MYHTLKTLYENVERNNPSVVENFNYLQKYCTDAYSETNGLPALNRGYKSIKWLSYVLREHLSREELEQAFVSVCEQFANDEEQLYNNIIESDVFKKHSNLFQHKKLDMSEYEIRPIGVFKVLINESANNITNRVFKQNLADIVIFRNDILQSAGVIFDSRSKTSVISYFDISAIHSKLNRRDNEKWSLVSTNLLVCGGAKGLNKTTITANEIYNLLEQNQI